MASALGGVLYTALEDTESKAKDLEGRIGSLDDGMAGFIKRLESLSVIESDALLRKQGEVVDDLREKLKTAEVQLKSFNGSLASDRLQGQAGSAASLRSEIEKLNSEIEKQVGIYDQINIQQTRKIQTDTAEASAVERLVKSAKSRAAGIVEVGGELKKSDRAQALYIAGLNNATEAQRKEINTAFDLIEALEKQKKAKRDASRQQTKDNTQERSDDRIIDRLKKETDSVTELVLRAEQERRSAILRSTEQGSAERGELLARSERLRSEQSIEETRKRLNDQESLEDDARKRKEEKDIEGLQKTLNINEETASSLYDLQKAAENVSSEINSSFANSLISVGDNFANTFAAAIVQGDSLSQALRGVAQTFLTDVWLALLKLARSMLSMRR